MINVTVLVIMKMIFFRKWMCFSLKFLTDDVKWKASERQDEFGNQMLGLYLHGILGKFSLLMIYDG